MQYCSLQSQTLFSPPDTFTTEFHFCFGLTTSFFLKLLVTVLCSSAGAYWAPCNLDGSSCGVISFYIVYGVLAARTREWFTTTSSSVFCRHRQADYEIQWRSKRTINSQTILNKKIKLEDSHYIILSLTVKLHIYNQISVVLVTGQIYMTMK